MLKIKMENNLTRYYILCYIEIDLIGCHNVIITEF